jgi:hypothetical protein
MNGLKSLASVIALVSGVVVVYAGYAFHARAGGQLLVGGLGVVLVVDSLACMYGARVAFAGSSLVSGLFVVSGLVVWSEGYSDLQWGAILLALVNAVLSGIAYKSSSAIPEQANPMNLPVFG